MGLADQQLNSLHNLLICLQNDISAEAERGELTLLEEGLYLNALRATSTIVNIRRLGLRFPDDD